MRTGTKTFLNRALALGVLAGIAGCSRVKQEDLDQQLATLQNEMRTEMQAGDTQTAADANQFTTTQTDALRQEMASFQRDLEALRADMSALEVAAANAVRFNVPVYFDYDDATVNDHEVLDRFVTVASEHFPRAVVTVEGFADPAGDPDYNHWLGQQRANNVREYITGPGKLDGALVRAVSYGESSERQVTPGAWGDEGVDNRRVALVIEKTEQVMEVTRR